jgi:hypothetical protein
MREVIFYCIVIPDVPTFYLNANVQGIVDENHASKIAMQMFPSATEVSVYKADDTYFMREYFNVDA